MPIPDFLNLTQHDNDGFLFTGHLDDLVGGTGRFLVDLDHLEWQWLARIPGWKDPVRRPVPKSATRALGKYGELWLASQLMRDGQNNLAIAQDRLRIDCVDLGLHDLQSYAIAGLHSYLPGQWNPA